MNRGKGEEKKRQKKIVTRGKKRGESGKKRMR